MTMQISLMRHFYSLAHSLNRVRSVNFLLQFGASKLTELVQFNWYFLITIHLMLIVNTYKSLLHPFQILFTSLQVFCAIRVSHDRRLTSDVWKNICSWQQTVLVHSRKSQRSPSSTNYLLMLSVKDSQLISQQKETRVENTEVAVKAQLWLKCFPQQCY